MQFQMLNMQGNKNSGFIFAMLAALFFGLSVPVSKILLGDVSPWLLAGLLYAGPGAGLFAVILFRYFLRISLSVETPIRGKKWLRLGGATFFGGVVGPALLLFGLTRTQASATSLLLNLESVLTILIARIIFREHVGLRVTIGSMLTILGCLILSWTNHFSLESLTGPMFILAACAAWAIDNNLTRKISASDPLQIAMLKSLMAGATNILLAMTACLFPR
ncbi:MAG: hypothetical protein ACD_62C00444G0006 [uncultured bacterium]|nr:MAG: hypothetical protein ACD_62C00444G0006 [uncultured bacterium]